MSLARYPEAVIVDGTRRHASICLLEQGARNVSQCHHAHATVERTDDEAADKRALHELLAKAIVERLNEEVEA